MIVHDHFSGKWFKPDSVTLEQALLYLVRSFFWRFKQFFLMITILLVITILLMKTILLMITIILTITILLTILHKPLLCPSSLHLKIIWQTKIFWCFFPFYLNMFQIRTIDPVVERDYSVVYFCAKYAHREKPTQSKISILRTSSENLISYWWLKEIYSQLPYHYRKNLKGLRISCNFGNLMQLFVSSCNF